MNVLVIGGNGFLGEEISKVFRDKDIHVCTASRTKGETDSQLNIEEYNSFSNLRENYFDVIINCASTLTAGSTEKLAHLYNVYHTNVIGSLNICRWVSEQKQISTIVNCSSLAVIPKPWETVVTEKTYPFPKGQHQIYASSKIVQEALFHQLRFQREIRICNVRYSSIYGPGMSESELVARFIASAKSTKRLCITNGKKIHTDFIHVSDAANIAYRSVIGQTVGTVNGASGVETSLYDLAQTIGETLPFNIRISNKDDSDIALSRAVVDVGKLNQFIDTSKFLSLSDGIKTMVRR